jgi:mannose-6-phosphate isomerase-like protein (cupin superfamily)
MPSGGQSDLHAHGEGELFYVLSGRCRIIVGSEEEDLEPGAAVWGPANIPHQILNRGNEPCRILWVLSPPGRERAIIEGST